MKFRGLAVGIVAAALAAVGNVVPAAAAAPVTNTTDGVMQASGCVVVRTGSKAGRVLTLFNCGSDLFGRVTYGSPGDLVYMKNLPSGATAGGSTVKSGSRQADTGRVSGNGWTVCVQPVTPPGKPKPLSWCI